MPHSYKSVELTSLRQLICSDLLLKFTNNSEAIYNHFESKRVVLVTVDNLVVSTTNFQFSCLNCLTLNKSKMHCQKKMIHSFCHSNGSGSRIKIVQSDHTDTCQNHSVKKTRNKAATFSHLHAKTRNKEKKYRYQVAICAQKCQ